MESDFILQSLFSAYKLFNGAGKRLRPEYTIAYRQFSPGGKRTIAAETEEEEGIRRQE